MSDVSDPVKSSWLSRNWKLILNVVTILALVILVYALRHQLVDTLSNLGKVNTLALLLLLPIEALNYHAQAKLYQGMFRAVGNELSYKFLIKTSLELNFVNHVFPSGGAAGISYFGVRMSGDEKISGGKATLVQVMKLMLQFLSFELLLGIGLIALAVMGKVSNITVLVAAVLSMGVLFGTLVFAYIVGSQARINQFFTGATKALNKIIQLVRPKHPETISIDKARTSFDDFHHNYKQIRRSYKQLQAPFWYAFLANVTEVWAVYIVFIAFGDFVNYGAVVIAYAVANFAGLVSVLPGGVGIYEALMTAVLASAGISLGVSLPVIVMYRVLNTLIQVPPGYYLYQQALRRGEKPIVVEPNEPR